MFIERIANTGFSSVGATSTTADAAPTELVNFSPQISINMTLLRSRRSCVDTNACSPWFEKGKLIFYAP